MGPANIVISTVTRYLINPLWRVTGVLPLQEFKKCVILELLVKTAYRLFFVQYFFNFVVVFGIYGFQFFSLLHKGQASTHVTVSHVVWNVVPE